MKRKFLIFWLVCIVNLYAAGTKMLSTLLSCKEETLKKLLEIDILFIFGRLKIFLPNR